jgi:hypothetical protein
MKEYILEAYFLIYISDSPHSCLESASVTEVAVPIRMPYLPGQRAQVKMGHSCET